MPSLGEFTGREILGTTPLATSEMRHAGVDRNNVAPRLGFAYSPDQKTVVRGGAGVYYGLSYSTNWQYAGAAWQNDVFMYPSNDSGVTQYASVENPFPTGFNMPSGTRYGALSNWGYANYNHSGTQDRLAEIYQWNLGVQRQLPGGIMVEASYSANRSTHLPWKKNPQNANVLPSEDRVKYGTAGLAQQVPNPFQFLFTGPDSIFPTSTDSAFNNGTVARRSILKKFPQFEKFKEALGNQGFLVGGCASRRPILHALGLDVGDAFGAGFREMLFVPGDAAVDGVDVVADFSEAMPFAGIADKDGFGTHVF